MNTGDRIRTLMSDVLEVDASSIHDEFGPADSELWDSLNALRLVTALEQEFAIRLGMDEIPAMTDFRTIRETVERHVGGTE